MKYFTIEEMEHSAIADAKGIKNIIPRQFIVNYEKLINDVLAPIRSEYGKPIIINSGYRGRGLNEAVGGVATSQHTCFGNSAAADITTKEGRKTNKILFYVIKHLIDTGQIKVDQLINENNFMWLHVGYKIEGKNRNQIFAL
jgi:hypothetical protein